MTDIKITVMHEVPARPARNTQPDALLPRDKQTFPMNGNDFTDEPLNARPVEAHRQAMAMDAAKSRVKDMSARYAKHARWMNACHAYSTAKDDGEIVELNVRKMPSKASKYHMYDDAWSVRQQLTDLGFTDVPGRPHTLYAIGEIVKYAREKLGMRALVL